MGAGPGFLTKILIFMPIWPILSLKLGYSGPKHVNKSEKWLLTTMGIEEPRI